jgi:hypothetical protein
VLENQLFLIVGFQHHGVLIERADTACQLDSAQQVDGDVSPLFAGGVEEGILDVLRLLIFNRRSP